MAEKDQQKLTVCPVCKHEYAHPIPDFCADCTWEFIFTNEETPEFKRYIREKIERHKGLYDRMNDMQAQVREMEGQLTETNKLLVEKSLEAAQLEAEVSAQQNRNTVLIQRLENSLSELEHAKAKLLDLTVTKTLEARHEKTSKVNISYEVEGRKWMKISFDKAGNGIPLIMYFYFAKVNPKRVERLYVYTSEVCLHIKSSDLIAENDYYKFAFPSFMETLEGNLEGFLALPFPGEFKIDSRIISVKF